MRAPCLKFWLPVANPRHPLGNDLEKVQWSRFLIWSRILVKKHTLCPGSPGYSTACSRSEKPSYLFCWCFSAMKPTTYIYYVCMLWFYFLKTVELMHDFILLPVYLISYVAFLDNSSFFTKIWITLNVKQPIVCHELLQIGWNAFGLNSLFTIYFL